MTKQLIGAVIRTSRAFDDKKVSFLVGDFAGREDSAERTEAWLVMMKKQRNTFKKREVRQRFSYAAKYYSK